MKKVIQLIIASVLLFCCKDNLAQEKTVENSLQQKINSVNNPTNLKNEIDLKKYLYQIQQTNPDVFKSGLVPLPRKIRIHEKSSN